MESAQFESMLAPYVLLPAATAVDAYSTWNPGKPALTVETNLNVNELLGDLTLLNGLTPQPRNRVLPI